MLWGVGTGRCGTQALAVQLGGVHEPAPWFGPESVAAAWGDGAAQQQCRGHIALRAQLDTPMVVDCQQSWLIPLICAVDPVASFVWLIRDPATCIASFLAGGAWRPTHAAPATLWHPRDGWPATYSPFDCALTYWVQVNTLIDLALQHLSVRWERWPTDTLTAHTNQHPASPGWRYTPEETRRVVDQTGPLWAVWRDPVR